jgi:hypothetical protein
MEKTIPDDYYAEFYDNEFEKYLGMKNSDTMVYAIREIPSTSSSSSWSNQFAYIALNDGPRPLAATVADMYLRFFPDGNSRYVNEMQAKEAKKILERIKNNVVPK